MAETASSPSSSTSPRRWPPALRRLLGPLLLSALVPLFVLLAGIAWIAVHFNPQTQSRQLVEQVRARTGYLLTPSAPPKLTFSPRLGLAWGPLLLEAPADEGQTGAPARRVAVAQSMHLSLDAWALLRGTTQVRDARIDGLSLWPAPDRRYALPSLTLNLNPITEPASPNQTGMSGTRNAAPTPALPNSAPAPAPAPGSVDPHQAPALTHALSLEATLLDATGQAVSLSLQGQIGLAPPTPSAMQGGAPGLRGALRLVLQGVFDQTTFALDASRADASPVLRFDLALGSLDLDHYLARPLSQVVQQTAAWQGGAASQAPDRQTSQVTAARVWTMSDAVAPSQPLRAPDRTPLRWLHELGLDRLDLQGTLRVAALKFKDVRLSHLRLQARAQDIPLQDSQGRKRHRIDLNPLTASLYDGGVHGALRIHLDADAAQAPRSTPLTTFVAAKLDLRDVRIGPLLRDALAIDGLEGRGHIALDLRSGGGTAQALKRQLNGKLGLQLQNGSVGLSLAELLRAGLGEIGKAHPLRKPQGTEEAARWRTPFDRLRASFEIENGVARNQDLSLEAPTLRVGGGGTAWLAENRLDYTLRMTIAPATLQPAPSGPQPALDGLQGLTIPVRLSGPFDDLQWRITYADIAPTPALRQRLRGWKRDTLDKLRGLLPPAKTRD